MKTTQRLRAIAIAWLTTFLLVITAGLPSPVAAATNSSLNAGSSLSAGGSLRSPNGRYRAVMQGDGNFVLYRDSKALWSAGTNGTGADRVVMQGDGNLVVYAGTKAKWSSGTAAGGGGGKLVMQDNGNLVVRTPDDRPTWSSSGGRTGNTNAQLAAGFGLGKGAKLRSSNGKFTAVMQADGNFVVYTGTKAIWASGTSGSGADHLAMQGDGNLVVYAGTKAKWSSRTNGSGANRVVMQDDGNMVVYAGNKAKWSSKTGGAPTSPGGLSSFKSWTLDSANWNSTTPAGNPGIDVDGAYGAQCADLGIAWSRQAGSPVGFDGWDDGSISKPGWHVVSGNLGSAKPGDVITRVGGIQHVVVVVGSPTNGAIDVLQQNPKSPHAKSYSTATSGVIWRLN